jgi:phosphoribosylglycinamide formyltransferase 1
MTRSHVTAQQETSGARIAVLISGSGTNLQAIMDACDDGRLNARVVVVVSNREDAYGLKRAERAGIPTVCHRLKPYLDDGRGREQFESDLAELVAGFRPDWVALAGWMLLLGMPFLSRFPGRVINLHPALPGQFAGVDAIARAYSAFRRGEITHTGAMVHLVPDEGMDDGPVIVCEETLILGDDTLESLEARIHAIEHRLYVQALEQLIARSSPGRACES